VASIPVSPPDVSVVIPTRDRWTMAATTVRSALAQEGPSVEVLLMDDGSATPAPGELRALGDGRLQVHRHETSRGPAPTRNAGIELARGRWIAFLDDDDLWSPNKLRDQVAAARGAWAYSGAVIFTTGAPVTCEAIALPAQDSLPKALIRRNVLPAGCSNVVAQADVVRAVGGFDTRLSQLSDWELWIRLAERGPATACDQIHVAYRRHPGNMIVSAEDPSAELDLIAEKHAGLAASTGERFDHAALAHWLAAEQRRAGRRRDAFATHLRATARLRDWSHLFSALRVPLGDRAMALREPEPREVAPPDWLQAQLR
jgi:glycosyltransferase involved in cell wall biosynthesis